MGKRLCTLLLASLAIVMVAAPALAAGGQESTAGAAAGPVYVEWWRNNQRGVTWQKDGPVSRWLIERTGVGFWMPLVIWEGGEGYFAKLQTRIASGDLPDILMPLKGIESMLAEDGMIWELSEYLPKYAPNIWSKIPKESWEVVRATDPSGKRGIYYIPNCTAYNDYGLFIRKDWLDNVGLALPTDGASYIAALKAFRDKDPNGNAQKDELPTIGREFGRWMDHLFFMYDVAMYEGYPQFDVYNGQLTYSGVTPNMKAAIQSIRSLYAEKLLDPNVFLNKANDLWAKVSSDKVGSWYHIPRGLDGMVFPDLANSNPKANVVVLPRIAAAGYSGHITNKSIWGPLYAFARKDEKTLIASLKLLDWLMDDDNIEDVTYGVEGIHHILKDGKKIINPDYDENTMEKSAGRIFLSYSDIIQATQMSLDAAPTELNRIGPTQCLQAVADSQKGQGKLIGQDGMPSTVFDGYPDISGHKIYQEYMTKIIIGEWPTDRFDEFVTKWNAAGGAEVTKRAREWYKKVGK